MLFFVCGFFVVVFLGFGGYLWAFLSDTFPGLTTTRKKNEHRLFLVFSFLIV